VERAHLYADESGQDTKGAFFLVSAVVVNGDQHDGILEWLESIEQRTRKGIAAWRSTEFKRKLDYLDRVLFDARLADAIYYSTYLETTAYRTCTITTVRRALDARYQDRTSYEVNVMVDGLLKNQRNRFAADLRQQGIPVRKVRGTRDASNALARLADAMAGFTRDAQGENRTEFHERLRRATASVHAV
jgi:Protein of unknown function (DUF3800)